MAKSAALNYSAALKPSAGDFAEARTQILVDGDPDTGLVHGLVRLPFLKDAYLLVVEKVDPQVFGYYSRTKAAVSDYNRLNDSRQQTQLQFAALYAMVALVVLLAAIWSGLWAANRSGWRDLAGELRAKFCEGVEGPVDFLRTQAITPAVLDLP